MNFREIFEEAKKKGLPLEKMFDEVMDEMEGVVAEVKKSNPEKHRKLVRKMNCIANNGHYGKNCAMEEVAEMEYTDKHGKKHKGGAWSMEQIDELTKDMQFPNGTTEWDKYVAFNEAKSRMGKSMDDHQIAKAAHDLWFDGEGVSIYEHMNGKPMKKG